MSRGRDLAKNTAILAFGKMCTQFIHFLLLPLYTAILDTSDYGTFDLLITYGTLLLPFVNWQFDQGVFRFALECRDRQEKQAELFSTICFANVVQVVVFCLLMYAACSFFQITHGLFLAVYVALHVFTALLMQFARGIGKRGTYAMASFLSASVTIVANVVVLLVLKMRLSGFLLASILGQVFTLVYLVIACKAWRLMDVRRIRKTVFKETCSYSLPLIPNNISWWVVNVSDRTVISHVLGVAVNGVYSVANKFPNLFINIYNIFNLSWTETVSLHIQDEDRDAFLSETIATVYKLFSCACFGIVACVPFVFPFLVNAQYHQAYPQILILMYAMLLRVIVGLYSSVYVAQKKSKTVAKTSAITAVINLTVNLLLIKEIGVYAASISTFVAFGIMTIIRYQDVNKTIQMKIPRGVLLSSVTLALLLVFTYYWNHPVGNVVALLVTGVYALVMNWDLMKKAIQMVKELLQRK